MRTLPAFAKLPSSTALRADDILEFHAARILLLLRITGINGRIDGLTKMAKLDFFVRYPQFFEKVARHIERPAAAATRTIESSMIRFHYGPWDQRYYHVLAYLEAKFLIQVSDHKNMRRLQLTPKGEAVANELRGQRSFQPVIEQMKRVKKTLGQKAGSTLKNLVYEVFDAEVAKRPLGAAISDDRA